MLIRWKSKDKSSPNPTNTSGGGSSSSSSKKKRKGREGGNTCVFALFSTKAQLKMFIKLPSSNVYFVVAARYSSLLDNDMKSGHMQSNEQVGEERRRGMRREDPRRHTLGGDMLAYTNQQNLQQQSQKALDLEMGTRTQKNKKMQPNRGYVPINQGPLFDDDPGIMSEVETASTGFRRGGKQRSSLPVVRTPSKTLERPLGLVFLQYRSETKRALLPNEITSIDTVRALFVRSFPRQLTMAYLEGPNVKIYIHDASKDMFYELEDVRSHLREIRDRSVLRLFESTEVAAPPQILPGGPGIPQPLPQTNTQHWDQDQSYFSEPEFDSDYKNQHIHKSKIGKQQAPYYVGGSQTLPRGMYTDRNKMTMDGYTSSPERSTRGSYEEPYYSQYGTRGPVIAPIIDEEQADVTMTEDQYALYGMKMGPGRMPRTNQLYDPTRPEDLHRIRVEHMERQLANLTGLVQKALVNQNPQIAPIPVPTLDPNYLVVPTQCHVNGSGEDLYVREKAPKLGKNACQKSVSFEKSVSFSDDIQGIPKSHSPQHAADTKPTKPAIKSSTLPRTSSQERDRLKPPPPPKPMVLAQTAHNNYRADIALAPEVYNHLRGLQKKAKDLRTEVRTLRRLSQAQAVAVREDIKSTFMRIRATLLASSGSIWGHQDQDATRISREEELYKQEVIRLEKDLSDLESSVESLRGEDQSSFLYYNMTAVEDMALVLSRASKTVAELKMKFPALSNGLRCILSSEMEKVVREEKFLKEEPDRLESALRRCKKLTGTLVTLKRLASVQEQRLPPTEPQTNEDPPRSADVSVADKPIPQPRMGTFAVGGGAPPENALDALLDELKTFSKPLIQNNEIRPDDSTSDDSTAMVQSTVTTQISQARLYNQTEAGTPPLLMASNSVSELQQQFNNIAINNQNNMTPITVPLITATNVSSLRRLHSMPTQCESDIVPIPIMRNIAKPPVPERNAELILKVGGKRIPPPPPPRTSSRSPLASPTSPNVPQPMPTVNEIEPKDSSLNVAIDSGGENSSGNESGNDNVQRQVALEMRHQELLKKQKMLQEQYQRLQQMSKMPSVDMSTGSASNLDPNSQQSLKKMGSESNIQQKLNLTINTNDSSGNAVNINNISSASSTSSNELVNNRNANDKLVNMKLNNTNGGGGGSGGNPTTNSTTTKQVYETEIL
ncbi:Coiled-coil domain-containing protein [Lucilia cuprina]|nr:Coiled-coil domain-containing protein [Lucilia cuprina]